MFIECLQYANSALGAGVTATNRTLKILGLMEFISGRVYR